MHFGPLEEFRIELYQKWIITISYIVFSLETCQKHSETDSLNPLSVQL